MDKGLQLLIEEHKVFMLLMQEDEKEVLYIVPSCFQWLYENYKVMLMMSEDMQDSIKEFSEFADRNMSPIERAEMDRYGYKSVLDTIGCYYEKTVWGEGHPKYRSMVSFN